MKTDRERHRSRVLAFILRHDKKSPLAAGGWLPVDHLISEKDFSADELFHIVADDEKMRFEFNGDRTQIRALYGHSVPVNLSMECKEPPAILFHGTSVKSLNQILENGLRPMSRNFVHLTDNRELAAATGARHGTPIVLGIDTIAMIESGFCFYNPVSHTWLVPEVPARFINRDVQLMTSGEAIN